MKNAKGAAKYIGRYLARPAIVEYQIMDYDREHFGMKIIEQENG